VNGETPLKPLVIVGEEKKVDNEDGGRSIIKKTIVWGQERKSVGERWAYQ